MVCSEGVVGGAVVWMVQCSVVVQWCGGAVVSVVHWCCPSVVVHWCGGTVVWWCSGTVVKCGDAVVWFSQVWSPAVVWWCSGQLT